MQLAFPNWDEIAPEAVDAFNYTPDPEDILTCTKCGKVFDALAEGARTLLTGVRITAS